MKKDFRGLKLIIAMFFLVVVSSCASKKNIVYLNKDTNNNSFQTNAAYVNTFQNDDNIVITVTADEPRLASNFNLIFLNAQANSVTNANNEILYSYLIDQNGEIDFPVIGKIKMAGLTRIEAEEKVKTLLKDYIANPGVSIRVLNFKVSVTGEVNRPGIQNVVGDRVTILEAISGAGDMTIYGKRKDILLIREIDGVTTSHTIDITDSNIINSPYYYLKHNDWIYVKPNNTRVNSSVIGPNLTVAISAISLLLAIINFSTR